VVSSVLLALSRTCAIRPGRCENAGARWWGPLVAVPYVRFHLLHPGALDEHLQRMDSVWVRDVPVAEKLRTGVRTYLQGLSPAFWFWPNNSFDLDRHTFKDCGNLPPIFLLPILIGLGICLLRARSSAHRPVLIAILAAPFSAVLVAVHNYRVLAMVVPAAILVCMGIDRVAGWLIDRGVPRSAVALACAAWLVGMAP
jgi:hypothetical protein